MTVIDVHQHVVPEFVLREAATGDGPFGLLFHDGLLRHPEGFDYPVEREFLRAQAKVGSLRQQRH